MNFPFRFSLAWTTKPVLILILLSQSTGCRIPENTAVSWTALRLETIGQSIASLHVLGYDVTKATSLEEVVNEAVKKKLIDADDYQSSKQYKEDWWGHALIWEKSFSEDEVYIRVLSNGPDGINQDGEGDDLFVEVRISTKNSETKIVLKSLTYDYKPRKIELKAPGSKH
jgi:hypothetical protein